jgi:hypothetical protein
MSSPSNAGAISAHLRGASKAVSAMAANVLQTAYRWVMGKPLSLRRLSVRAA